MSKAVKQFLLLTAICLPLTAAWGQASRDIGANGLSSNPRELLEQEPRQLHVIGATLAAEELDRAVFERLLQEIANAPSELAQQLHITDAQLQDIAVTLSNARSFINDNEVASLRAMCKAWGETSVQGDARIQIALDAYKARRQFTLNFIQRYYTRVRLEIEATLDAPAKQQFASYMTDQRRRMANAGATYSSVITENVRSGAESVEFHCGAPRTNQEQR